MEGFVDSSVFSELPDNGSISSSTSSSLTSLEEEETHLTELHGAQER